MCMQARQVGTGCCVVGYLSLGRATGATTPAFDVFRSRDTSILNFIQRARAASHQTALDDDRLQIALSSDCLHAAMK